MRATINGFEDIDKLFDQLDDTKKVSLKAVEKAGPHLVKGAERAVKAAASRGYATGDLAGSFAAMKPKTNEQGAYLIVRPVGRDKNGRDYYARGAWLEFGTTLKKKRKNSPEPWRDSAIGYARDECEKAMEDVVNEEIDKL